MTFAKNWREFRELTRGRLVDKYDDTEAKNYDAYVGTLSDDDEVAYLEDMQSAISWSEGQSVLDVGAGPGTFAKLLSRLDQLSLTALEPSPAMCEIMRGKFPRGQVKIIEGGCDSRSDRDHFSESSFDAVVCRQVVNSLFDPLVAFQNWLYWLKPGGHAVVIEGIYGRDAWKGSLEEEIDVLPLSANQSLATIPYLLDFLGFCVESVGWMNRVNQRPSTRTKRFMVIARKP